MAHDDTSSVPGDADLHYVADRTEFEDTDRIMVEVGGREIAVFELDGEFYALANYCVHQGGPLCEGSVSGTVTTTDDFELEYARDGEIVSCPWHGWEFDIKTGEHLSQTGYMTPRYDVVARKGEVYVVL